MTGRSVAIGAVNWIGLWTLYSKEVRRFLSVYKQTLLAPVISIVIFMTVFGIALGRAVTTVAGLPFMEFLAPGLVMMAVIQNAFENNSSSVMTAKIQGNIVDVLMPPLTPAEIVLAYAGGGVTRGLAVGCVAALMSAAIVPPALADWGAILYFGLMAALMLSLLGLIVAIWADKVDDRAMVTNFVITPLAFLSGTFYSVERLEGAWHLLSTLNPFFYLIDGFRYGFTGYAEAPLGLSMALVGGLNLLLILLAYRMLARGYKLKP